MLRLSRRWRIASMRPAEAAFPGAEAGRPLGVSAAPVFSAGSAALTWPDSCMRSLRVRKAVMAALSAASRKSWRLLVCYKPLAAVLAALLSPRLA